VVSAVDALPRTLFWMLDRAAGNLAPAAATPLWLVAAPCTWAVLGGALGWLLGSLVPGGARVLAALAWPLRGTVRALGMKGLAGYFDLR
jgi:hypothetical protein